MRPSQTLHIALRPLCERHRFVKSANLGIHRLLEHSWNHLFVGWVASYQSTGPLSSYQTLLETLGGVSRFERPDPKSQQQGGSER